MLTLAGIYEKLADESEDKRLRAAHSLLKDFEPKSTSIEQIKVIITRLFRGLCSSRKAARLGFSVALTEYLIEVNVQRGASIENGIPASSVIDILDNETTPEGNNSGQDERDHYFGRLFGVEAVIKSNILVKQQDLVQWKRLLDLICGIANKKPWLKQECGWILYSCVKTFSSSESSLLEDFVLDIVEKLTAHKLIRTPEGLAIWLEVSQAFPDAKLPKDVWKHRDPLSKKDITLLADVLKDAKTRSNSDQDEHKSQGRAMWSAQLHFAWDVVLARLYRLACSISNGEVNGKHNKKDYKTVDMNTFWIQAVDESLFAPTSSPERKHWGLLLLSKVLTEAPELLLRDVFSKNAMSCLINALKGEDRYLQRTAQKAMQSLQKRIEAEPEVAAALLKDLLLSTNYIDFDKLTKTKTVEKLLSIEDIDAQLGLVKALGEAVQKPGLENPEDAAARRRQIILLQGKFFAQWMSRPGNIELYSENNPGQARRLELYDVPPLGVLMAWIDAAYFATAESDVEMSNDTRGLAKARLSTHLEQALKAGGLGKHMLCAAIGKIHFREKASQQTVIAFDPGVRSILDRGWQRFESLGLYWNGDVESVKLDGKSTPFKEGLLLLYCLTLFQVYNGDAEAVEILEDLLVYHEQAELRSTKTSAHKTEDQSDALIEILLSFASKPSKFLRRVINIIFEGIAPQVTSKGLESLVRILGTKESVEGQHEMFDAADEDVDSQDEDDSAASDVEMLDSDVELVLSSSDSEPESEEEEEESNDEDDEDGEDEELAAFDAKLAAALGTKKVSNGAEVDDDSSTSGASDTDMDDDQMMVLDEKLAEVFRARQQESGKKREKKDAKETIVNFKNRVLDLLEIYLKVEYLASQSLRLLLPLLQLARKTKTKQLADRACNILNDSCKRCKGVNVPACSDALAGIELLLELHAEAGTGASNAHANAASHASILVVKSLVNSGVKIGEVVDVYGETQKRMLTDKKCKVQAGLFTDWNNWCISARERFAE